MNSFANSIDTDMGIGSILGNFETPWIMHTVQDSLNMKFRPFSEPMPNFVDILNRQFDMILTAGPDYREKIEFTRQETFKEIIEAICSYYGLSFTESYDNITPIELYGIAHNLYDIFISRFTDYMIEFFISYIINNVDSIYAYLISDDTIRKPREKDSMAKTYVDQKFMLIHANINKVIMNMITYDIPLETLIQYFTDQSTANRLCSLLADTGDIYKYHYAVYLQDQRYMAELLTCIKLRLQARTQQSYTIADNL